MVGYSPWGLKESDTTERLHLVFLILLDSLNPEGTEILAHLTGWAFTRGIKNSLLNRRNQQHSSKPCLLFNCAVELPDFSEGNKLVTKAVHTQPCAGGRWGQAAGTGEGAPEQAAGEESRTSLSVVSSLEGPTLKLQSFGHLTPWKRP